jgi:hypothetical protein
MKSERRHELQHNELAEWLFKAGQEVKPYQNYALAAVVAVVVLMAVYSVMSRASAAKNAQAWDELITSVDTQNTSSMTKVAETYPGTDVAYMASVVAADFGLAEGCEQRFANKAQAMKALSGAVASYSMVLDQCRTPSLIERATYGLARAKETQGDLGAATDLYGKVAAGKGTYAGAASDRLQDLQLRDTKLMFDYLSHLDPKPSFSNQPGIGLSPNFGGETVPEEGPIVTPEPKSQTKPDAKKPEKEEPKKK